MHLMGHSYGGLIAMYYAIQYPQHLQSLMLVSSAGADPSYAEAQFKTVNERLSPEDREKVSKMTAPGMLDSKEGWIKLMKVIWKPYVFDQQKVKLIKDAVSDHTSLIQKHVSKSINGYNLHDQLANLKVPTLIIHGAYDPVPLSASQKTHQAIKGSKLVVLEECGHFPFIEQPKLFTKTIIEFAQSIKNK
jgi:proline iminopeptidase